MILSIKVGSSARAFELLTRFDTSHRCSKVIRCGLEQFDARFTTEPPFKILLGQPGRHVIMDLGCGGRCEYSRSCLRSMSFVDVRDFAGSCPAG